MSFSNVEPEQRAQILREMVWIRSETRGAYLSDEFLTEVALEWFAEVQHDGKYGSVKRLAQSRGVPYQTAKDWLKKARDRGLLPLREEGF